MKKIKRKYLVATAILIFTVACAGMGAAYAADDSGDKFNPMGDLAMAIAQKFNLSVSDVQSVFDAQKAKMQTQRQQAFTDRVNQAVTAGTLTQDQATKISAKKAEFETLQTGLAGKTAPERAAALENFNSSLKQWATDNSIPAGYMFEGMGGGHGRGGRGFGR